MPGLSFSSGLLGLFTGFGLLAAVTSPATAAPALDGDKMADATAYLGLLAGRELSPDDAAWFREQWAQEERVSPGSAAVEVDDLAFSFQRHQRDQDPIRLARDREAIAKSAYCGAKQSSDATAHRLQEILMPDDLVLAADCRLGLVATRFDADGLVASHGLTASATGQGHDVESDRSATTGMITDGFAGAAPGQKMLMANGELRHAFFRRFWTVIDGSPEQAAVLREIGAAAAADVRNPARQLESLALSKLGERDYLARVGDAKLTAGALSIYDQWLERIAGYGFSSRDRDWLHQVIIRDFEDDPNKVLDELADIKVMNRDYVLLKSHEEKWRRVASWAAGLHCYLDASSDPDEIRLAEIVFREDPVIEADCGANIIRRQSHTVLAEGGGQQLLEQDIDVGMRFTAMILGRPLLPEEREIVRRDSIDTFKEDPAVWREEATQLQALLANVEKHDTSVFLGMDERKKLFDPIYCGLKSSEEPYAADYLAMFRKEGAVLFEDCDRQLVTTEDEIQAIVTVANFLALLNDQPALDEAMVQEIRDGFTSKDMGQAESSMLALREWWSLLSIDEKAAEAEKAKERGINIESDAKTVRGYIENAKLQVVLRNAKIESCRLSAIIVQGQTAIFGAKQGPYTYASESPLGIDGVELGGLISTSNALAELCKGVPGG